MEIEQLKSATSEDQMEMMMLMDKLPDFYGAYNDVSELVPPTEFPAGATNCNNSPNNNNTSVAASSSSMQQFLENPQIPNSPPFMILPNTPIQDQSPHDFLSSITSPPCEEAAAARWRGGHELSGGADTYSGSIPCGQKKNSMAAMREMIFRIAAMQPIHIDPESVKPPKRRNVKISKDPQSVAARHRRERISERIRILQRLVPGGTKMDTASMLDEAIHYVKFLKTQVQSLERAQANRPGGGGIGFPVAMSSGSYFPIGKAAYHHQQPPLHLHQHHQQTSQDVQNYGDA